MANTPKLSMPEIAENQASKYLTHNEALRILDALCQLTVIDKDLDTPPVSPDDGDTYIVGATDSSSGDWDGYDGYIAYYKNTAWYFIEPQDGWLAYVADEDAFYKYEGASSLWGILNLGTVSFLGLTDTPASYSGQALKLVRVNAGESALEFATLSIVTDFTDLGDVPSSYSGEGGKSVRVNSGATALEFFTEPYDIGGNYPATPTAGLVICRIPMVRSVNFPANFSGSQGVAGAAATAETTFIIKKDATQIGTMVFALGATTATFTTESGAAKSLAAGEVLTITAPDPADATLAHIGFILAGTRG